MPIAHPQTDAEFSSIMANAGTVPLVVDFFATWCGPCQNIAPVFQELSDRYVNLKFAKVDTEKCNETASSHQISALPTFLVFLNGQKMDVMSGANPSGLEGFVRKWSENCPTTLESMVSGQIDLQGFIDRNQCECLNEHDNHTLQNFLSGAGKLVSDVDEQLIINLMFQQPVKIHSIFLKNDKRDTMPKTVKLFVNSARTLDFDGAQSTPSIQTLEFNETEELKTLYYVKFQDVRNLQLFIVDNQGGGDQTTIERLTIYGTPLAAVNMNEFKRVSGKAGEVGH